jgi:TPR repeat protein
MSKRVRGSTIVRVSARSTKVALMAPADVVESADCCSSSSSSSSSSYSKRPRTDPGGPEIEVETDSAVVIDEALAEFERCEQLLFGVRRHKQADWDELMCLAVGGSMTAKAIIAICYADKGIFLVRKDNNMAAKYGKMCIDWLTQLAGQLVPFACFLLADFNVLAIGMERNATEALRLYKVAVEGEITSALYILGGMFESGDGCEKDFIESGRLYALSASRGHPTAMNDLGRFHEMGHGMPKNIAEARRLYGESADMGVNLGQNNLGLCYEYGKGGAVDCQEAIRLYKLAAEKNNKNGQYNLGRCYLMGIGAPTNIVEGIRLLRLAVEQEYAPASLLLGDCYRSGVGVETNLIKAIEWYKDAAELGSDEAISAWRRFQEFVAAL